MLRGGGCLLLRQGGALVAEVGVVLHDEGWGTVPLADSPPPWGWNDPARATVVCEGYRTCTRALG